MDAVYIPHILRAQNQTLGWEFEDYLPGLTTLTPVRGHLRVKHCGNFLEVTATAETITTLTCDRCLCQYNHPLSVDLSEIIMLAEAVTDPELEADFASDDLVESLPPDGEFHGEDWLYEQFCLALPPQQLCREDCPGIELAPAETEPIGDGRWAALNALKRQLGET